ncbi:MAG TPA: head GIN domain-containing protein [Bacteroidales bacterium]|nr:head GIN domain-containing protein [Bacteroidales bacterium]
MKNLRLLTVAIALISITACSDAQVRNTVHGNNNVVTKERKVESFTGVKTSSGIDVYLKQGDNESVSVEADDNIQEYILTEVKGGVLHVWTDANIRDAESKKVLVTMKEVNSVETSSAGDVYGETPVKSENLELSASSAGNIKLEVHAKKIDVSISSSGDITLTGNAESLEADLSSAGDLNASNLEVKEADVSVSSAGDADINVSEKLTARASSAGDITYTGDPKYVDAHSSSAGGIHRK